MIAYDIDIEKYHSGAELSKTSLDALAKSPAHYWAHYRSANRPARTQTAAQLEGNMAHCAILEPSKFAERYPVGPGGVTRAHKDWKAWEGTLKPGQIGIKPEDLPAAKAKARSVHSLVNVWNNLTAGEMILKSRAEVSAYWTDPATGIACRCRPDLVYPVNDHQVVLLDAKGYGDASAKEFGRQAGSMRYHVQDAFYSEGYALASGMEVLAFIFLVTETAWPYASASYRLGPESRQEGYNEVRELLDIYAQCERLKFWPGYATTTTVIDIPSYMLTPQEVEVSYAAE